MNKYAVKRTKGNHVILNNWANKICGANGFYQDNEYIISPWIYGSLKAGVLSDIPKDYIEISFQDFVNLVINEKQIKQYLIY